MPRYIDADALIKKIYPIGIGDGKYTINAQAVKFAIDNAPTADAVEVVRCKDCTFGEIDFEGSGCVQCKNRDAPWRRYNEDFVMGQNDFCSYAKKKGE